MANAIVESVPATHTGEASGVNSIARTIGSSIGSAVVAALIASDVTKQGLPTDHSFTIAFWICAVVGALSVIAAALLPSARRRRQEALAAGVEDLAPEVEASVSRQSAVGTQTA
jgi:MFS family permease